MDPNNPFDPQQMGFAEEVCDLLAKAKVGSDRIITAVHDTGSKAVNAINEIVQKVKALFGAVVLVLLLGSTAAAVPPVAQDACPCSGPGNCTCAPKACACAACIVAPKPGTVYRWRESIDPNYLCLFADGQWIGSYSFAAGTYYQRVGEGGRRAACPVAAPGRPAAVTALPFFFRGATGGCASGSCGR